MIGKLWPDSNCWCWGASCLSHAIWMRWSFTRPRASQKASAGFRSTPSQVIIMLTPPAATSEQNEMFRLDPDLPNYCSQLWRRGFNVPRRGRWFLGFKFEAPSTESPCGSSWESGGFLQILPEPAIKISLSQADVLSFHMFSPTPPWLASGKRVGTVGPRSPLTHPDVAQVSHPKPRGSCCCAAIVLPRVAGACELERSTGGAASCDFPKHVRPVSICFMNKILVDVVSRTLASASWSPSCFGKVLGCNLQSHETS